MGGLANRQAVTRVNPEQASKVKLGVPSCLRKGEGRCAVQATTVGRIWLRRTEVVGTACRTRTTGQRGRPNPARLWHASTSLRAAAGLGIGEAHSTEEAG